MASLNLDYLKHNNLILKGIHYDSHVIKQWVSLVRLQEPWLKGSSVLQRFIIDVSGVQSDSNTTEAKQV